MTRPAATGGPDAARRAAAIARGLSAAEVDVDGLVAELYLLPPDLPGRGALAVGLVVTLMRGAPLARMQSLGHLEALIDIADADPSAGPQWAQLRPHARAMALMVAAAENRLGDPGAVRAQLAELDRAADGNAGMTALNAVTRAAIDFARAVEDGDVSALRQVGERTEEFRQLGVPGTEPLLDVLGLGARLMEANQRGDMDAMWAILAKVNDAARRLPPGHQLGEMVDRAVTMFAGLRGAAGAQPEGGPTADQLAAIQALAERTDLSDHERSMAHAGMGGLLVGSETDPDRVDAGIEHFRQAAAVPTGDTSQPILLLGLAIGLVRRNELSGDIADLYEAASLLEETRRVAQGPHNPLWAFVSEVLSVVQRRLGATAEPTTIALEGLRRYAWRVLLQPDPVAAAQAAQEAASDAVEVARQCLMDNNPADAIRALDAGRGLLLFAATEVRNVVDRLLAAGRPDLAGEWSRASASGGPDSLPTDLRRDMLAALSSESATAAGLLDPPGLGEIRQALTTLDADVLVYLVPGTAPGGGWAITAPVQGPPSYMALPNLLLASDVDVERHLATLARRGGAPPAEGPQDSPAEGPQDGPAEGSVEEWDVTRDMTPRSARSNFLDSLDALCDWAWRAAMGPLVERYLPELPAPPGRERRVILIPMGPLALIPWAAARKHDGTYAVQHAAFSQVASARMLCDCAGWPPVRILPVGLVVGDPDTGDKDNEDLLAARTEAYAIHRAFYPGGRYLGRTVDGTPSLSGTGTAEAVRAWLTTMRPGAGAMLHLACHAVTDTRPDGSLSHLLLADHGRLSAREVIDLMSRSPQRAVGLVVLAACRTGLSIHGYDEAYSLGTAFLAGGVRSVLSTRWSVLDRSTSVLMFMFHRYLMVEGRPVWDALRRAQLWMLDPARETPPEMPDRLRSQLSRIDPASVVAWAGFVHWGQ